MNTTEAAARSKWCPQVRASVGVEDNNACNSVVSRDDSPRVPPFSLCIASDCMMWRWLEYNSWVEPEEEAPARRRGYCGLAGPITF